MLHICFILTCSQITSTYINRKRSFSFIISARQIPLELLVFDCIGKICLTWEKLWVEKADIFQYTIAKCLIMMQKPLSTIPRSQIRYFWISRVDRIHCQNGLFFQASIHLDIPNYQVSLFPKNDSPSVQWPIISNYCIIRMLLM